MPMKMPKATENTMTTIPAFNRSDLSLASLEDRSATPGHLLEPAERFFGRVHVVDDPSSPVDFYRMQKLDLLVRRLGIRLGPRTLSTAGLVLSALLLAVGALADNVTVAITALCVCFACNQLTEAPFWVATMAVAGPHSQVATGVLNTGGNITGIVGGMLVPLTAGWFGWPAAILSGSLFALVGAILWLFVRADETMLAHEG